MVCVAVFFLSSCYQFEERVNGLEIYSSQFHGDAFAAYYYWDLNSEQMDIVIPDTYRNYPVRHIGGVFRTRSSCRFYSRLGCVGS